MTRKLPWYTLEITQRRPNVMSEMSGFPPTDNQTPTFSPLSLSLSQLDSALLWRPERTLTVTLIQRGKNDLTHSEGEEGRKEERGFKILRHNAIFSGFPRSTARFPCLRNRPSEWCLLLWVFNWRSNKGGSTVSIPKSGGFQIFRVKNCFCLTIP